MKLDPSPPVPATTPRPILSPPSPHLCAHLLAALNPIIAVPKRVDLIRVILQEHLLESPLHSVLVLAVQLLLVHLELAGTLLLELQLVWGFRGYECGGRF